MVDEEGETVGLYSMQLCPREGNQPGVMVLARQHPNAVLSHFRSLHSCCQNLRRGGEGDGKVPEAVLAFPPQDPLGTPYRARKQV
jgi:hypothetical protein